MDIIDPEKLKELEELSGGTKDLLKTLLDKYIVNAGSFVEQIRNALKNKDNEKILFAVHTLKGSSLSLGLIILGNKFTELNANAKQGDFNGFESAMNEVDVLLKEVEAYRKSLG
ncbi:MAG: Hpt domain-containing protein [Spirochaetia bacterium]|nr:Hpt domain-containing protein [Spirochaetia bacterium]